MAYDTDKPRSPTKDLGWLALFLIAIGVIWFAQGGLSKITSTNLIQKTEFEPGNSQISSGGETGGNSSGNQQNISIPLIESPYKGKISLYAYGARETDPQREYLEIRVISKTEPILITCWTLEGRESLDIAIGQGSYLPYSGQINPQNQIYLGDDEKTVIITGQSPIGTSFRLNSCTGYFNQFQKFYPYLPEECPEIPKESVPLSYTDACFDFVGTLPRCRILSNIPYETSLKIGNDCILFINEKMGYNSCVNKNKNSEDFYKKEWRIYLGRGKEMWNNQREHITLRDREGRIVSEILY